MVVRKLQKVIDKGSDVSFDKISNREWINFSLRIRKDLLKGIDSAIEKRIGMTKTSWILEAIQEKLQGFKHELD
jgi:hypothetical protein